MTLSEPVQVEESENANSKQDSENQEAAAVDDGAEARDFEESPASVNRDLDTEAVAETTEEVTPAEVQEQEPVAEEDEAGSTQEQPLSQEVEQPVNYQEEHQPDNSPDTSPAEEQHDEQSPPDHIAVAPVDSSSKGLQQEAVRGNNLIVNYVPRSCTDTTLYELFTPFGEIESARSIIDRQSGQCQGYGFVKFVSSDSASAAVAHFQNVIPDERQLKVHFARPSSTHKQCNIYVSGLPVTYTDADVLSLFQLYGPVVEIKLLLGKDGESRGCGFVRLSNIAKTHTAIAALNESVPPNGSSRISVSLAAGTKRESMMNAAPFGGYSPQTFNPPPFYGGYPSSQPSYGAPGYYPNPYEQQQMAMPSAQGYGYYPHAGDPSQAYGRYPVPPAYPGSYAPARHTPVARPDVSPYGAPPGIAQASGRTSYTGVCLFCFNLPMEYDENSLRSMFCQFGVVSNVKVMRDPLTGRSKGYGFVNLATEEQALAAIAALNGYPIAGKALKVQFKTPGPGTGSVAPVGMPTQQVPGYY